MLGIYKLQLTMLYDAVPTKAEGVFHRSSNGDVWNERVLRSNSHNGRMESLDHEHAVKLKEHVPHGHHT